MTGPGDTIPMVDGHAVVNGKRLPDPFTNACAAGDPCTYPRSVKIAAGYWFLLEDNRGESLDSRFWGPVPTQWIIGKVES